MRSSLVAVLLAACYSPSPLSGAPCSPSGACPTGLSCIMDVCSSSVAPDDAPPRDTDGPRDALPDARPPDGSTVDSDGDGVPDRVDNCAAIPNGDQHDEDGDGFGDVCDHCPGIASAIDTDGDGDGVGDACDPNPLVAGDKLLFFESFATAPLGWTMQGNWQFVSDDAAIALTGPDEAYLIPPVAGSTHGTVTASFTPGASVGTGARGVGVALPFQPQIDKGTACDLESPGGAALALALVQTKSATITNSVDFAWQADLPALLTDHQTDAIAACAVSQNGLTANVSGVAFTLQPNLVALRTKSVSVRFHWIMWVESP